MLRPLSSLLGDSPQGQTVQFGFGWDANYLRRIPGLPKSESWKQDPVYWDRTQTVRQTVEVDIGSTTLIGGGLQVSASVPTFRDIPLVGSLFAGRSLNESSTELIILISARITLDRE